MNIIYSMDHGNIFPSENLGATQRDINKAGSFARYDRICHSGANPESSTGTRVMDAVARHAFSPRGARSCRRSSSAFPDLTALLGRGKHDYGAAQCPCPASSAMSKPTESGFVWLNAAMVQA